MPSHTLAELAQQVGAEIVGDASIQVTSIATLASAENGQISFLSNSKHRAQLTSTRASAVILSRADSEHCPCAALVVADPYVGFARIAQVLDSTPAAAVGIATSAVIDASASIGTGTSVGACSVIEAGAVIGDNVEIGAGCFIGRNATIGSGTKIWANVSIYHAVSLGRDCLIQSGSTIGSDGFGYANDKGQWIKIPQLGAVTIGDNCEIGANTCIDRGALDNTVIGQGVIIDNLCHIAHNVVIGDHTAMAGCSVAAGSATIGKYCVIGGFVAINGHIDIADKVNLTGYRMVT